MRTHKPVMLMILDGWGLRDERADNAVALAHTPNFDRFMRDFPNARLAAHGAAVGLPDGQMGNSEVGHLNIGAGRVVMQDLPRIDRAAADGELAQRVADSGLIEALRASGGVCHLMGLMSHGGVHAHQNHALALARIVTAAGLTVRLHAFTDGRDCAPDSARRDLAELAAALPAGASIATVSGRFFAMDRDHRWERVARAYDAIVSAQGRPVRSWQEALAAAPDLSDEFVEPSVIAPYAGMASGDAILVTNFRADRIRELLDALLEPEFDGFARSRTVSLPAAIGMVSYGAALDHRMKALFEPQTLANGLSETLSKAGLTQIHLAETEKYPHVTYFLNGGLEERWPGEDWVTIASPKVATYDLQPEMSAPELGARVLAAVTGGEYDAIIVNFANPDMVGHTGHLGAAIAAVETVDGVIGPIVDAVLQRGGAAIITADHGNCESMRDPVTGGPHTAHTLNPVPVIVAARDAPKDVRDGILADLAPTFLALAGCVQPAAMTGRSLIDES